MGLSVSISGQLVTTSPSPTAVCQGRSALASRCSTGVPDARAALCSLQAWHRDRPAAPRTVGGISCVRRSVHGVQRYPSSIVRVSASAICRRRVMRLTSRRCFFSATCDRTSGSSSLPCWAIMSRKSFSGSSALSVLGMRTGTTWFARAAEGEVCF